MFKINKYFIALLLLSQYSFAQFGGPSPIKVAQVQEVMMAPVRKIPATVSPKVVTTIKAESKGVVKQLVDIGSFVKKGEVLALLTDTQSKLRASELNDALNSASARYEFLKSEKSRLQDLVAKNLISQTELEQNKSDFLSAKSEMAQSQSRLNQYKDQVNKLAIMAPFDGYVLKQFTQSGALLNAGSDLIEFMQSGNLEVIVYVPYKYKSQIKPQAKWKIQSQNGQLIDAVISQFTPAATGLSHTIEVHLSLNDKNIWSGESVNVLVPMQSPKKVIAVPRDALVIRRGGSFVYTVVDKKARKVDIKTGMAQGELIEVMGQLSIGDIIVIRGNERLRPNAEVKIIE